MHKAPKSSPANAIPSSFRLPVQVLGILLSFCLLSSVAFAFFGEFGIKEEKELGDKFYTYIRSSMPIIEDPEIAEYVRELGKRIQQNMPPQPWDITLDVIRSSQLNAFAGPGGHVFIYSGLILSVEHESDLAGVTAHEFAHVTQRHLASQIERQQLVTPAALLGVLAGALVGGKDAGGALIMGSQAAAHSAMLAYSRENEREADHVGMNYLQEATFNPQGMVRGFEALKRKQWYSGGSIPTYLSTHPGLDERIVAMQDRIKRMSPEVQRIPDNDERFRRVQILLRARYTDANTALSYFDKPDGELNGLELMGKGIVLSRLNRITDARSIFESATAKAGNDPLVLREAGRFYFENGDFDRAAVCLQKAYIMNSRDLMTLFFYARLLGEKGENAKAIEYMRRVSYSLPDDSEVHFHLGRMYGKNGDLFHAHLELAYAAMYSNDKKKAQFHQKEAQRYAQNDEEKKELETFATKSAERSKLN